jgi:hypothetical protein
LPNLLPKVTEILWVKRKDTRRSVKLKDTEIPWVKHKATKRSVRLKDTETPWVKHKATKRSVRLKDTETPWVKHKATKRSVKLKDTETPWVKHKATKRSVRLKDTEIPWAKRKAIKANKIWRLMSLRLHSKSSPKQKIGVFHPPRKHLSLDKPSISSYFGAGVYIGGSCWLKLLLWQPFYFLVYIYSPFACTYQERNLYLLVNAKGLYAILITLFL